MKNITKRIASMIACLACIVSISTNAYARSYNVDKRNEYTEVITKADDNSIGFCLYCNNSKSIIDSEPDILKYK